MSEWYQIENQNEVASPALLLYPDRIEENLRRMIAIAGGVEALRPHVKTHKIAEIVRMKLGMGIRKFKVSTIAEAEMVASTGGKDVLLAFPLVGPNVDRFLRLMALYPGTQFSSLVDDLVVLDQIAKAAVGGGQVIHLFIDLNVGMGRTGIGPGDDALALYRQMARAEGVHASGIHAYDGHLHEDDYARLEEAVAAAFEPVWAMRRQLEIEGHCVPKVIAAGTPTSKILAEHPGVEVGAGTTVLWDAGQRKSSPHLDFLNAAVLLARVVSRPQAGRLCIDLGHKSVASEFPQPRVQFFGLEDAVAVVHSEEHLVLESDRADEFPVGTVLYGIPFHICPTVALYEEVLCVRNGKASETWHVAARRRKITV
jgi:D-threonine aldolase